MKFQTILLTFFGVMAVVGLMTFANSDTKKSGGDDKTLSEASGNVVIWGTFPLNSDFSDVIADFNKSYKDIFSISYVFHDPKTFDNEIVEALASGRGPDILLLPDELVMRHSDKIELISYARFPQNTFSSMFIQAAEIYMRKDGLAALPFAVDPMVMYWNRDLFNNASIAVPPKYWEEFLTLTPKLTKRNSKSLELTQSAVSFGEFSNVKNAKELLSMLFLQVGNPIVEYEKNAPVSRLASNGKLSTPVPDQSIVSALRFFMDFADPSKSIYTWSKARGNSLDEFIDGNLAIHFDYASEYQNIKLKNPHLNFAIANVPQPKNTAAEVTTAKVYGLSVLKTSKNKPTAFVAVTKLLTDAQPAKKFADAFGLPPVRRDQLVNKPSDEAFFIFYDAAIRARTWLDPKPSATDRIFSSMIDKISSGYAPSDTALEAAHTELNAELLPYLKQ